MFSGVRKISWTKIYI